jgi:hypothetical protein
MYSASPRTSFSWTPFRITLCGSDRFLQTLLRVSITVLRTRISFTDFYRNSLRAWNTVFSFMCFEQCSPNTIRIVFGGSPIKVVRLIGDFGHYSNNHVPSILYTKSNAIPNYQLYLRLSGHYYYLPPPPLLTHPSPVNIIASWYCLRLVCSFFRDNITTYTKNRFRCS